MRFNKLIFNNLLSKKNLTQDKIAEKLGTTRSNVSGWVHRENIPGKYEDKLLEILGVTASVLKGESSDIINEPEALYIQTPSRFEEVISLFRSCNNIINSPESCGCIEKGDRLGLVDIDSDKWANLVPGKYYYIKADHYELVREVIPTKQKGFIYFKNESHESSLPFTDIDKLQLVKTWNKTK